MGSSVSVAGPRYVIGLLALGVILASVGVAAVRTRRRWLPDWEGPPAWLADAVIGLALLVAVMEILGAVGLFRLVPLLAVTAAVGVAVSWALREDGRGSRRRADGGAGAARRATRTTAILCAVVAAAVLAEWAGPTFSSFDFGIRTFDSLWYHLPWAASFAQSGQITTLHFTDLEYLTAFYPATAELFHGLGIVLFTRDTLSPALNLGWVGLVLLAGYCVGRPWRLGAMTLLGAAVAMSTPMLDLSQAGSAANDVVGVFFLLAAVALYLNSADSSPALVLAGLSVGLAVAVKLSMLGPALALTVGVLALAPPRRRGVTAVRWFVPLLLAGGFWYLRNLIAVGNPLPWVDLPGLATPAPALQSHTGFSIAHYLTATHVWAGILEPGLASGFGPWWWAILAGAVLGPLLCLLPGAGARVRMLGLVALASTAAYLITPETAAGPANQPLGFAFNLRYCAPALTLSLVALPLAPMLRGARVRWIVAGGLVVVLAAGLAQARLWPARQAIGQVLVAAAVLIAGALAALIRRHARAAERRRSPIRIAVAGLAAAILVLVCVLGASAQRRYLRSRYAFQPGVSYLAELWAFFRHVHHARVGIVGTFGGFFSYPLYGVDDTNRVQYVAVKGSHGSFTEIGSCRAWRSTVDALHLRYLVTTPNRDPWHPKQLSAAPEAAWTAGDPAAQVLYRRRAAGQEAVVYALSGPLSPAGCRTPRG